MSTPIRIIGDIDDRMVEQFLKQLKPQREKEITIILTTDGGCVYSAFAIYDLIKLNRDNFTFKIVAAGKCFSAGNIIMQAADVREALPNTEFLIHYGFDASTSDTEKRHNNKMDKRIRKTISEKVNVTKRTLNTWFKQETYLGAQEAVNKGLIDRITL